MMAMPSTSSSKCHDCSIIFIIADPPLYLFSVLPAHYLHVFCNAVPRNQAGYAAVLNNCQPAPILIYHKFKRLHGVAVLIDLPAFIVRDKNISRFFVLPQDPRDAPYLLQ